ncbi:thioesterase II family protein [Streptomyces sp. NPDC059740]|uniref:thioesterase II family protein n=1 Tax=Streptomyces sp. NPDC059740 TaxID=3346926 RepID=UPI003654CDE2
MSDAPVVADYPAPEPAATAWKALFLPHSGGSAASYRTLAHHLAGAARTAGVEYPGRGRRSAAPLFTDLHALADEVAEAVAAWREDAPLLLFGHSLGAAVAYEVVRRTPARHRTVLVVSGHPAPSHLSLSELLRTGSEDPVPDPAQDPVVALVARLGGDGAALLAHPTLRHLFLPVIRSDLTAHSRYRPERGARVDCPVLALTGDADPLTDEAGTRAWARHTTAGFRHHSFAGGHFFPTEHAGEVAAVLRETMAGAPAGTAVI